MISRLDIKRVRTIETVRDFVVGGEPVDFQFTDRRPRRDPRTPRVIATRSLSSLPGPAGRRATTTLRGYQLARARWRGPRGSRTMNAAAQGGRGPESGRRPDRGPGARFPST